MKKIIVALLITALAVSILALVGCGGNGGGGSDTPEQVVNGFMEATLAMDADAVFNMLSEDSKAEVADKQELVEGSTDAIDSYEVGKATISGDEARVSTSIAMKQIDSTLDFEVVLVKEGGAWKISLSETGASMDEAFQKLMEEIDIP
jgi:hypothetical protein